MSQVFSRCVINISSFNYHSDSMGYVLLSFPESLSNFHNNHIARNEQSQDLNVESELNVPSALCPQNTCCSAHDFRSFIDSLRTVGESHLRTTAKQP